MTLPTRFPSNLSTSIARYPMRLLLCTGVGLLAATLLADTHHGLTPVVAQGSSKATPAKPADKKVAKSNTPVGKPQAEEHVALSLSKEWQKTYGFTAGKTVTISVHLEHPALLPANGRVAVEWVLEGGAPEGLPAGIAGKALGPNQRTADAFGIYTQPTANWRKILHALDGDVYMVYRAPVTGKYTLKLTPVTDEAPEADATPRWRERGNAPTLAALPRLTPWPAGTVAPVSVQVLPLNPGTASPLEDPWTRTILAAEPNDTPELAQTILLDPDKNATDITTWEILGGADETEFFDNGKSGRSGDNWFRLVYKGTEPRLLTAQLSMPNQQVAARIRVYRSPGITDPTQESIQTLLKHDTATPALLNLSEYREGQDGNERVHQQDEEHRANVNRVLKPGDTYYLRVEANSPGYQLQLRMLKPAPYTDPEMAIRQGMYTQIGQVDAWITNRPRGISMERRLRDTGNLLGTGCMSCHTQSGVWGPSVPLLQGYPLENTQNYWHLIDVMYECLRPTNQLKDAANNTSLAPLDIGDGPAGTRAAGFNIVNLERWRKPSKLHSKQQIRTANFVMQTGDPGGINAAGPGSNIGFVIVNTMATEILKTAWEQTSDPQYFRKMQEKARQVLAVNPQFTDDVALRLDYFYRVFPIKSYATWAAKAAQQEATLKEKDKAKESDPKVAVATTKDKPAPKPEVKVETPEESAAFVGKVTAQLVQDEARLRAIQQPDGSWNFSPGTTTDNGKTWTPGAGGSDPSPTALGITGLTSAGYKKDDPTIARAVKALLAMQDPSGRWNRAAQTGFVSTAYALHALSRLYPTSSSQPLGGNASPSSAQPTALAGINNIRRLTLGTGPQFENSSPEKMRLETFLQGAKDSSPQVRYWAMIGLGSLHSEKGIAALIHGLGDRTKMVRDAAVWGTRHTLLDDKGWNQVLTAAEKGDDYTRESAWQALTMRADIVMPQAHVDVARLTALFDRALNRDPHPAVRAWASKAAWNWWVWNPPVRNALNQSWVRLLERPEPNAEVENCVRYSSQMLFIANGHKANGSREHQYKELSTLFTDITKHLDTNDEATKLRLARRLVGIGGTFYTMSGGDGGPGQMGYVTEGAGEMMGKATLLYLDHFASASGNAPKADTLPATGHDLEGAARLTSLRAGLEGGANVPYTPLTSFLVDYSIKGPEELRKLAAAAISDPRTVSVAAVPELVEPQMAQVKRGAQEPPRREQVSDPIIELWAKVNWIVPKREEQQRAFFDLMIPQFTQYVSPEQIAAIADPAERARVQREMDAAWYLADRLGYVLATNPDLHQDIVLNHYFPTSFKNPLEELFWTRSVEWLLTYTPTAATKTASITMPRHSKYAVCQPPANSATATPKVDTKAAPPAPDPTLIIKDHALQLYLDQLKPTANSKTRAIAIRMANQTALRTNPEVLRSLNEALTFEKDPELVNLIQNVLKQSDSRFLPDLKAALKAEKHPSVAFDAMGEPALTEAQQKDILYFRDYMLPELTRQKRNDQQSCMGCHGVPGRVPSLGLRAPDKFGFLPVADMLFNYRTLQGKVNLVDIEKSKLLRKPLNIQDGKEDGHQGGRRYAPTDPGYLVIRKWVENQSGVQK